MYFILFCKTFLDIWDIKCSMWCPCRVQPTPPMSMWESDDKVSASQPASQPQHKQINMRILPVKFCPSVGLLTHGGDVTFLKSCVSTALQDVLGAVCYHLYIYREWNTCKSTVKEAALPVGLGIISLLTPGWRLHRFHNDWEWVGVWCPPWLQAHW